MTRRRGILALLLAPCALVVTACAGLPTGGPPNPGLENGGTGAGSPERVVHPRPAAARRHPEQIVEGFIDAGSGPGRHGNWDVAREFLAPVIARDLEARGRRDRSMSRADRDYSSTTEESVVDFARRGRHGRRQRRVRARGPRARRAAVPPRAAGRTASGASPRRPTGSARRDAFPTVFHRYSADVLRPDVAVPRARTSAGSPRRTRPAASRTPS